MEFTISVGESRKSTSWKPQSVSWEAFCGLLAPSKCVRTHETMDEWEAMTKDERAAVKDIGGYVGDLFGAFGDFYGNINMGGAPMVSLI